MCLKPLIFIHISYGQKLANVLLLVNEQSRPDPNYTESHIFQSAFNTLFCRVGKKFGVLTDNLKIDVFLIKI